MSSLAPAPVQPKSPRRWRLPLINAAWWAVLFGFLGLFSYAAYQYANNVHKLLDAFAAFVSVAGSVFIGFGVLMGRREAQGLEAHITALKEALKNNGIAAAVRGIENLQLVKATSRLRTIPGEVESLRKVELGLTETDKALQQVAEHLDALFSKQVEMARDATIWFELGIVVVMSGAGLTVFTALIST